MRLPAQLMKTKSYKWYIVTFIAVASLSAAYAVQRDLLGRYAQYQQREEQVRSMQRQVDAFEEQVSRAQQRVKDLDADPLELEAAIRHIKRLVREGETIYRIQPKSTTE